MESVNPATGEEIATYEDHDADDVDAALGAARDAFEPWADRAIEERCALLDDAADVLREKTEKYAELMTEEMGKPIDQARSEVEKCAWVCEYYAEHAPEQLQPERMASDAGNRAEVRYEPLGPVLAVMPWNFPFWQVFRFAAPHLVAGNVGLLKHASNVPGCALAIEDVFEEAGFPVDVFQTLLVGSDLVEDVIQDDRLAAVTLTGSEAAGRSVAETAGSELKKTVLELGGSDPFVVLEDADVQAAAETGAWARVQNSGQSCIAAKRFIVHEDVYDEFVDAFVDEMDDFDVGDPKEEGTDIGPQAREDLMHDMHEQVRQSVEAGATVQTGGEPLDWDGPYYPPTVLTDVPRNSPAATEEVFGPAAAVFKAHGEDHAIEIANDTEFGLGANLWTDDTERANRLADDLRAGCVFVNSYVASDPRLPFGGIKNSGYGRELSEHGIREFVNRKTVFVE
jgi:succinate-semialdehyde dehydrogenase/glutarate-semialdehyde dehydrogenase